MQAIGCRMPSTVLHVCGCAARLARPRCIHGRRGGNFCPDLGAIRRSAPAIDHANDRFSCDGGQSFCRRRGDSLAINRKCFLHAASGARFGRCYRSRLFARCTRRGTCTVALRRSRCAEPRYAAMGRTPSLCPSAAADCTRGLWLELPTKIRVSDSAQLFASTLG